MQVLAGLLQWSDYAQVLGLPDTSFLSHRSKDVSPFQMSSTIHSRNRTKLSYFHKLSCFSLTLSCCSLFPCLSLAFNNLFPRGRHTSVITLAGTSYTPPKHWMLPAMSPKTLPRPLISSHDGNPRDTLQDHIGHVKQHKGGVGQVQSKAFEKQGQTSAP